jgi:signal transduction histidine kinase
MTTALAPPPLSQTTASQATARPVAAGYPRLAAVLVAGLGIAVLTGWVTDTAVLKSFVPGLIEMKVNTAACFVLAGVSLWVQAHPSTSRAALVVARLCAGAVLFLGTGSLCEWIFGWDLHIDQLLFTEPASAIYTSAPGRMAPNTAINFMCDSLALLLIDARWRQVRPAQILCLVEIILAMLALLVYVYGVGKVFGLLQFTPMAVHTAIGFLVLSTGILWARAENGPMKLVVSRTSGGALVRRLLPLVVLVPLLIAWVCMRGIDAGVIDVSFAFAVFTMATIILLAVPIWFVARALFQSEEARRGQVEMALAHGIELERINGELVALQQSKELLMNMVVHDLRNPLTASIGYLDMVERKNAVTDPVVNRYVVHARDANLRLLDMINGILDIVRMEDGKLPVTAEMTDVTALIAAKLEQYQGAAAQGGLRLHHDHPAESTCFVTDAALLGRVVDNLIVNALKHTPAGGSVTVSEHPMDGSRLAIHVSDTGEGIAKADIERLFQKYGRVEGQTMGRKYDTGLGLVFCRMAISRLRGSIRVESELGKGSTFIIELG